VASASSSRPGAVRSEFRSRWHPIGLDFLALVVVCPQSYSAARRRVTIWRDGTTGRTPLMGVASKADMARVALGGTGI